MSNQSESDERSTFAPDDESPPAAPRWVKAFGIAAIALVVLFIAMMASGHGGPHSPLRHFHTHGGDASQLPAVPPR